MFRAIASMIAVAWLCLGAASAQTYPDYKSTYVNDIAGLLVRSQEAEITDMLRELASETGIEFTVVTIDRMANYDHNGSIETFATGLFNHWGVGDADRDDGVMLLVARSDRQLRIEMGARYGRTKDDEMKAIIDRVIVPDFRRDDYPGGIKAGVEHIIHEVAGVWPGEFNANTPTRWWNGAVRTFGAWLLVLLAPLGGIAFWFYRKVQRVRPRKCPVDGTRMGLVFEEYEDNHLESGQVIEEAIDSIQYDVWKCPDCEHVTVEAYRKWFSRYGACRECNFKTVEGDTFTEVHATTYSTGRKRTDYNCRHCHAAYSTYKTIPMVTTSSSSSSGGSSGGSFGGGSSGGGGASGSW